VDPDRDDALRLGRGDAGGLSGLMSRHQDRLFRYLRRLVGEETVAEDVFQQTWVQVAERISRYDRKRPFGPWLFAVARNLAYDRLRARRPESLEDHPEPDAAAGQDPGPDAFARAVARQRGERLAAVLDGLGTADREVLALRFGEDLALPELAATLGVPLPTAKARLYRALARLRALLLERAPREDWT
jgi:RNA polymerase sigma-70 factor (ECF subfamily)